MAYFKDTEAGIRELARDEVRLEAQQAFGISDGDRESIELFTDES